MKQTTLWLMVLGIVLAGCAAPIETQTPTTDTAAPSPVPTTTPKSETSPTATPIGGGTGHITYLSGNISNQVYSINADGSNRTLLIAEGSDMSNPDWAPNGMWLAFDSARDGYYAIYRVRADGSQLTRLTDSQLKGQDPSWSPDGARIVFVSNREGNDEVYIMDADGSNVVRLTQNFATDNSPSWSPDGKKVAFVSDRDGGKNVYTMNVDGSGVTQITHNSADEPAWSPDGKQIAFVSDRGGEMNIYTMSLDGSGVTQITHNSADVPAWSPDGKQIAFFSARSDNYDVYVIHADGSGETRLTNGPSIDWFPVWQPTPKILPPMALTPIPTLTPATYGPLTIQEPSLQQLSDYLRSIFPDYYGIEAQSQFVSEDISGDGKADLVAFDRDYGTIALALIYQDVTGDSEADLVMYDRTQLFVLLWADNHYTEPFRLTHWVTRCCPTLSVSLADWTGDEIPEVVFDFTDMSGGTGIWIAYTTRYIIHCQATECKLVWEQLLLRSTDDSNWGGLDGYHADMQATHDRNGNPAIRYLFEGFSIYCCSGYDSFDYASSLNVITTTLSLYSWTGEKFQLTDEQIVSRAQRIESQASLNATSADGISATISAEPNNWADRGNDVCQLSMAGKSIGSRFGCKGNFTTVEWKDVTNDGQNEIVIIALSGREPLDTVDRGGEQLSDVRCVHQHLIAYRWDGNSANEIANVAGCVLQKDLYGVRLQDIDGDGQVEILTAPNGELHNRAYKWNGEKFVLWSDIPEP